MNEWLVKMDLPPEKTITAARKSLRKVYIHIEDVAMGRFEERKKNMAELRARIDEIGAYPRNEAKKNCLKVFLRKL